MKKIFAILLLVALMATACNAVINVDQTEPTQQNDSQTEITEPMEEKIFDTIYTKKEGIEVIYFAGGCFWGIEKLMQSIPGVVAATSGYANGQAEIVPTYEQVVSGETGYRETVRVEYKPAEVSLDALVFAYYQVIDPTVANAQGNDIGTQYQTGIYYADDAAKETVERITAIVKQRYEDFVCLLYTSPSPRDRG